MAPPFDRSVYKEMCICSGNEIVLARHGSGVEATYSIGGNMGSKPCDLQELEYKAKRYAAVATDARVCVSGAKPSSAETRRLGPSDRSGQSEESQMPGYRLLEIMCLNP